MSAYKSNKIEQKNDYLDLSGNFSANEQINEQSAEYLANLEGYFGNQAEQINNAIVEATKKILAHAETQADREHLIGLIKESSSYWTEAELQKQKNEFVHGTGSNALFGILRQGKIVRRGDEFGGADIVMGHEIAKTETGEREPYISVSENQPMGFSLSYFYAKGFGRRETQNLAIDADEINGSNSVLESWDATPIEERQRLQNEYGYTRERLAAVSERQHYFRQEIEREKLFIYQHILDTLNSNQVINVPDGIDNSGEIEQLIGKSPNIDVLNVIYANIISNKKKWPGSDNSHYIKKYQKLLDRTQNQLKRFEELSPEEQQRKTHQYSVILTLDKSRITARAEKTKKDENGRERPIHPSEQETRIYGDIDIEAVTAIQVPEANIDEVKKQIEAVTDLELKNKLNKIRIIPLELYEVERVVKKCSRSN